MGICRMRHIPVRTSQKGGDTMPVIRPHFSITQLNQYLHCPYSYMCQYVHRVPWSHTPSSLAFGSVCHSAIEQFNRSLMNDSPIDLPQLFEAEWDDTEAEFKANEKDEMKERGIKLMEMFVEEFSDAKPQAVEKRFRLPLIDPSGTFYGRDIVGVIDCIADDTIIEYKTSARSLKQKDADESIQLSLYSWAYQMSYGKTEEAIKLIALVRTKQPRIQVFETQRSKGDHITAFQILSDVIRAVDLKVFYRNIMNHSCNTCVYKEQCDR